MRIAYSDHAVTRMEKRGITEAMIQYILTTPDSLIEGQTADEYTALVDGVPICVVVARGTEPPLVITVYEVDR